MCYQTHKHKKNAKMANEKTFNPTVDTQQRQTTIPDLNNLDSSLNTINDGTFQSNQNKYDAIPVERHIGDDEVVPDYAPIIESNSDLCPPFKLFKSNKKNATTNTCYYTPVLEIIPISSEKGYIELHDTNQSIYRFRVLHHLPKIQEQAARQYLQNNSIPVPLSITQLTIAGIQFSLQDTELNSSCQIDQMPQEPMILNNTIIITIKVPKDKAEYFKLLLNNGGIGLIAQITFDKVILKSRINTLSFENIEQTKTIKKLQSEGSSHITAAQAEGIINEAITELKDSTYIDKDAPELPESSELFKEIIANVTQQIVENKQKAKEFDEQIRIGTGFTADEYKPIELYYDLTEIVANSESRETANSQVKRCYDENKSAFETQAKFGWGPFSASASYSQSHTDITDNTFKDDAAFKKFKDDHTTKVGKDIKIVPRGITLIEKGQFLNKLKLTVTRRITVNAGNTKGEIVLFSNTDQIQKYTKLMHTYKANSVEDLANKIADSEKKKAAAIEAKKKDAEARSNVREKTKNHQR